MNSDNRELEESVGCVGRILVRENNEAGLFIPIGKVKLQPGLYDIMNILGELQLEYRGKVHGDTEYLKGLTPSQIVGNEQFLMTTEEHTRYLKRKGIVKKESNNI